MDWLNEGAGLIALISAIVTVVLLVVVICILWGVRNKLAVQKLNFLGFYSTDAETRINYAELTFGNKSLGEIAIVELGILNGKVNFDLTSFYRKKSGIAPNIRLVIEQRNSIRFTMSEQELWSVLIDGKKGKELKKLRLYVVDLTGNMYRGKIPAVQKLLKRSMARVKAGLMAPPPPLAEAPSAPSPAPIPPAGNRKGSASVHSAGNLQAPEFSDTAQGTDPSVEFYQAEPTAETPTEESPAPYHELLPDETDN